MILETIIDGISYLTAQGPAGLFSLFWLVILFELPRYLFSFVAAAFFTRTENVPVADLRRVGRVGVIIAGHNEEDSVESCVRSLWEQSMPPDEIVIVSDGSTDRMKRKLAELLHAGLIHGAHSTELRAGKSAATNLAERLAKAEILINVDCDCSFDRHAIRRIVQPFRDPKVGAVSGNIFLRNSNSTIICKFQAIEYLLSISLGKRVLGMLGQVCCASGAFGAFRHKALRDVGGLDSGGGEDLDVTLRLRQKGWKIEFAHDAICYTDAPSNLGALVRQRMRWERDAVRLRYRKHIDVINPLSRRFQPAELFHEVEFLLFNVIGAAAMPFYVMWLVAHYGPYALVVLAGAQMGLFAMDFTTFALAAYATPKIASARLVPYVIGYSIFNGIVMRTIRLAAYLQEWVFRASYSDTYVPDKVHMVRG